MGQIYLKKELKGDSRKEIPQLWPINIQRFFNKEIEKGKLRAFTVSGKKKSYKGNIATIMIERKAVITRLSNIDQYGEYLLECNKKNYLLSIRWRCGFIGSKPTASCFKYVLRKIVSDFNIENLKKIKALKISNGRLIAPSKAVQTQLIVDYHVNFGDFIVTNTSLWYVRLKREPEIEDDLFKGFLQFINERIPIAS